MIVIYAPNVKQGTGIDREKWQSGLRKKVSDATAYRHGVLCDFCFNLFRQVTCNFCRNLANPPEEVYHNTRPGLFSCPEYGPAKPYPWVRIGSNGHYAIKEAARYNSEERISPWQPPFNWYLRFPKGSCVSSCQWPLLEAWRSYKRAPGTREPTAPTFCVIDWPLFPKRSHLKQSELSDRTAVPGRIVITLDISEELLIMPDELSLPHGRPYTPVVSGSGWGKAPYKKYPNPVYLPGSEYHHGTGPIERVEFRSQNAKARYTLPRDR